jgi:hypothetical protein
MMSTGRGTVGAGLFAPEIDASSRGYLKRFDGNDD